MRTLFLALVVAAVPSAVSAQQVVCPYGLVAVDGSHCCWPGQSFDAGRNACAGVPQCPAGLAPYGETCMVGQAAPQQPQPQQPEQPQPPPPPPPSATDLPPPPPPPPPPGYLAVPPAAMQQGFTVRFEASKSENEFTVSVDNSGMCRTPCEIAVPPGRHRVNITGAADFRQDLDFPAQASVVKIDRRRGGSVALAVVGLSVGIPVGVIGALFALTGAALSEAGETATGSDFILGGAIAAVAGFTFAGVGAGVGFGTAGKNRVTLEPAAGARLDDSPGLQLLSIGAGPTPGGAMVGASFAF